MTDAPPLHDELVSRAEPLPVQAATLQINDHAGYDAASQLLLAVQGLLKEAEDFFREPKQKAAQAHKSICDAEKKITDPLTRARNLLKDKMSAWIKRDMEREEAENRRARELAQEQDAAAIEQQIEEAESRGASANEVRAILRQSSTLPPPVPKPMVRVQGIATHEVWLGQVTDKRAFVQAALNDNRMFELVEINQGKLNKLAAVLKRALSFPGLRVSSNAAISASRQQGGRFL
jgi:hypothetical protein